MENGIRGGKKPPQHNDNDDRVEFTKLFFHEPPRTIEITQQISGVEHTQTIAISKISTFATWETDREGYEYKYWLKIELVSGKEHTFGICDKNKFDELVGILKAGVR